MTAPVFESGGLELPGVCLPAIRLGPGETATWCTGGEHGAELAMDNTLGLRRPAPGTAVWFGRDLARLRAAEVLSVLQRISPLNENGSLLGNINICENILLPVLERRAGDMREYERQLDELLAAPPWSGWFPRSQLSLLPHQIDEADHRMAAILRAAMGRPEAVVACNLFSRLERSSRPRVEAAAAWLRGHLPGCAWLLLGCETSLPPGFPGNKLPARP
jgi:predicted ABC-type transport system involved in lysophospholipase L1 biosynthesis ATPase subunit